MHQWSLSELQGVSSAQQGVSSTQQAASSTQQGVWTPRTAQDGARGGSGRRCLCPPTAAPLWAWLLLGALLVPGAWSFLSEEQEELLVELHNYYRGQVSPSASAMLPLKWDPTLKVIAEGYAAKCVWNHNPELEETGENLFAGTGSLDLREALEKWFLERLDYDYQNNSCDEDKMCGHYTQMVWADTHRVGCAFHLCNNMEGLDWERVSFLVCNYYPAGNYEDERPYVEGDWCSRCPENLQTCENNLCVADTVEEEDEEGEDEDTTSFPPLATSDPSLSPEGEGEGAEEGEGEGEEDGEEEGDVLPPPPTTTGSFIPTTSTPSTTSSSQDSEDATPALSTHPKILSTKQGQEEGSPDEIKEKEDQMAAEREKDVVRKSNRNMSAAAGGSVASPSLLLACLTGMITVRL